jgi:hypothetical protein
MAWGDASPAAQPENASTIEYLLAFLPLGILLVLGLWMPNPLFNILKQAASVLGAH